MECKIEIRIPLHELAAHRGWRQFRSSTNSFMPTLTRDAEAAAPSSNDEEPTANEAEAVQVKILVGAAEAAKLAQEDEGATKQHIPPPFSHIEAAASLTTTSENNDDDASKNYDEDLSEALQLRGSIHKEELADRMSDVIGLGSGHIVTKPARLVKSINILVPLPESTKTEEEMDIIQARARAAAGYVHPTSDGCTIVARGEGDVCAKHEANIDKRCSQEGCNNQVINGEACIRHGAEVIKCTHETAPEGGDTKKAPMSADDATKY